MGIPPGVWGGSGAGPAPFVSGRGRGRVAPPVQDAVNVRVHLPIPGSSKPSVRTRFAGLAARRAGPGGRRGHRYFPAVALKAAAMA